MITLVIVSYNTRELLIKCLQSVLETTTHLDVTVVVVDNASSDDSAQAVREKFPQCSLIALQENIGFAAACNLGVAAHRSEHVLLLNPDAVLLPGCVNALLDAQERLPQAGVIGGQTLNEDGTVNPASCFALPTLWSMTCFALGLSAAFPRHRWSDPESMGRWARDTEQEVGMVSGCLLLCKRELWDRVGGMDETYFVYGEDADFAFKVRQAGYRPHLTPDARCIHLGGASSSSSAGKWMMLLRGKVTLMRRWWPKPKAALGIRLLLTGAWLRSGAGRLRIPVKGPWRENWRDRAQWLGGWEAQPNLPRPIVLVPDRRLGG